MWELAALIVGALVTIGYLVMDMDGMPPWRELWRELWADPVFHIIGVIAIGMALQAWAGAAWALFWFMLAGYKVFGDLLRRVRSAESEVEALRNSIR